MENLNITSNNTAFNTALVGATEDAEGTLLTPGVIPGVGADPVWSAVLNAPTDHLDGVTTEVLAGLVLVDTTSIGFEVLIDSHGDGDGTLLHDFHLDVLDTLHTVRRLGESLVVLVGNTVSSLRAGTGAGWGLVLWESVATNHAWWWGDVVSAGWEGVWLAGGASSLVSIVTASGDTDLGEPVPGTRWLTTVAAHGEGAGEASAARVGILRSEDLGGITSADAVTVVEGLSGTEGPARTAIRLVTDTASDGRALWPSSADIEGLWDLSSLDLPLGLLDGRGNVAFLVWEDGTEHLLNVSDGGVGELDWDSSVPGGLHGL